MKDEGNTGVEKELIPLHDITPKARSIAVAWIENYQPMGFDIQQKHKLASDIMNYSNEQNAALIASLKELIEVAEDLQGKVSDYWINRETERYKSAIENAKKLAP